jgi:hypothetical protein
MAYIMPKDILEFKKPAAVSMRYVVARHCYGGIGDHLSCLMGAWWFAKRTNRTLVVDWRGSRFNPDPSMQNNCFFKFFKTAPQIGDIQVIADDTVSDLNYPAPLWPAKWTQPILSSPNHVSHDVAEIAQANSLIASEGDRSEPTVILNQWLDPPPRPVVKEFLLGLKVVDSIADETQRFWNEHIGARQAIAIHIRHGNGENLGSRAAYWLGPAALSKQLMINARNDLHKPVATGRFFDNMPLSLIGGLGQTKYERRLCQRIAKAYKSLAAPNAVPVLFSDAEHIFDLMREVLPSVVTKRKQQIKRGGGPLHQIAVGSAIDSKGLRSSTVSDHIAFDMFVELELMRRCSGLIFMDSGFSLLARASLDEKRLIRLRPNLINRIILRILG